MSSVLLVSDVVPHKKTMSLLDEILEYGEESLKAKVTINENTLFLNDGKIPAYVGIEYMAQSIAAFSGAKERLKGCEAKVGFLVGTRKYDSTVSSFSQDTDLIIDVKQEFQAVNGLGVFNCSISDDSGIIVTCVLNVFQPEDVGEFLSSNKASTSSTIP